jgi:chromosome segregation ATPase
VDGLAPILAAIIASVGTIVGAVLGARRLAGHRTKGSDSTIAAGWRQQAELEKARADLLEEQRDDERDANADAAARISTLEGQLNTTRHDLDDCVRQREKAFSDLRALERRRQPRMPA